MRTIILTCLLALIGCSDMADPLALEVTDVAGSASVAASVAASAVWEPHEEIEVQQGASHSLEISTNNLSSVTWRLHTDDGGWCGYQVSVECGSLTFARKNLRRGVGFAKVTYTAPSTSTVNRIMVFGYDMNRRFQVVSTWRITIP